MNTPRQATETQCFTFDCCHPNSRPSSSFCSPSSSHPCSSMNPFHPCSSIFCSTCPFPSSHNDLSCNCLSHVPPGVSICILQFSPCCNGPQCLTQMDTAHGFAMISSTCTGSTPILHQSRLFHLCVVPPQKTTSEDFVRKRSAR